MKLNFGELSKIFDELWDKHMSVVDNREAFRVDWIKALAAAEWTEDEWFDVLGVRIDENARAEETLKKRS